MRWANPAWVDRGLASCRGRGGGFAEDTEKGIGAASLLSPPLTPLFQHPHFLDPVPTEEGVGVQKHGQHLKQPLNQIVSWRQGAGQRGPL